MKINDFLSERRKTLNLTLLDVAKACDVSESTVSRWESGAIENMRRDKCAALAKILRIDPAVIMGWQDVPALSLTRDEEDLVIAFRRAPEGRRDSVRALLGL